MKEYQKQYERFLIDSVHEIFRNRLHCKGKYFNVYVKNGSFITKLQDMAYVDLLSRSELLETVIDPLHSISGTEIQKLYGIADRDIPDEEYEEFVNITAGEIRDYIQEEIPYSLFEKWIEFY